MTDRSGRDPPSPIIPRLAHNPPGKSYASPQLANIRHPYRPTRTPPPPPTAPPQAPIPTAPAPPPFNPNYIHPTAPVQPYLPTPKMATGQIKLENLDLVVPSEPTKSPVFLPDLRTFYGYSPMEDAVRWFQDFTVLCNHARWTRNERLQGIARHLDGSAREWYFSLDDVTKNDYDKFVKAFSQAFGPQSADSYLLEDEWERCAQNTDLVRKYASRLKAIAVNLGRSENEQRSKFINNLRPDIRNEVLRRVPRTLQDAIEYATQAESYLKRISQTQPSPHSVTALSSGAESEDIRELKKQIQQLKLQVACKSDQRTGPANKRRDQNSRIICQYCQKVGHDEFVCRRKQSDQFQRPVARRPNITCNYCTKPGHTYNECRTRLRAQKQQQQQNQARRNNSYQENRYAPPITSIQQPTYPYYPQSQPPTAPHLQNQYYPALQPEGQAYPQQPQSVPSAPVRQNSKKLVSHQATVQKTTTNSKRFIRNCHRS